MKLMQQFRLKQTYHEIEFYAYDIEKIELITKEHLSKVFVPECSRILGRADDCKPNNVLECVNCKYPHFQDLFIDGWYVGNKYGKLDENCYLAYLQTGIRVPVNKEIYDAWVNGFTNEPQYSNDTIYDLSNV